MFHFKIIILLRLSPIFGIYIVKINKSAFKTIIFLINNNGQHIDIWIDKEDVVHLFNGILLSY